jgi:hypothetical protein
VCIERGEIASENLKRDRVEPSPIEVQGVHREELHLEFRRRQNY